MKIPTIKRLRKQITELKYELGIACSGMKSNWDSYQMALDKLEESETASKQLCENYKELYDDFQKASAKANTTSDLLEACIQARAALPDAWFSEKCGVPTEVIDLLNTAIAKAEAAGVEINTALILQAEGLSVGEKVDFVNDYGVVFKGKTITRIEVIDGENRYHIIPDETPWYPPRRRNLFKTQEWQWDFQHHGQHVFFPQEDWRSEVANDKTCLGYQEWVVGKIEDLMYGTHLVGVDAIEVAGCTEADGHVDVVQEGEVAADFFSVYTHRPNMGVECICDFNTKAQAIRFARVLAARGGNYFAPLPVYGNLCSLEVQDGL